MNDEKIEKKFCGYSGKVGPVYFTIIDSGEKMDIFYVTSDGKVIKDGRFVIEFSKK